MATTVEDYINLHGSTVAAAVTAQSADFLELHKERAWATYGMTSDDEEDASEDLKEMVALTALAEMIESTLDQTGATSGAVQRIRVGSDNTPDITFYDRAKMASTYRKSITDKLSRIQRKLGYMPYLDPQPGDYPFVIERVDMITDEVTDGVYDADEEE